MKLSIIIPVLNESFNLQKLLPFLKDHTSADTQIIVVISKETKDNSLEICNTYGITSVEVEKTNRAYQMNKGAQNAHGDVLCFLHADVVPPALFESHIRNAIGDGFVFGLFSYQFDKESFWLRLNARFTKGKSIFFGGGDQIHFVIRNVFEQLGGYNEGCGFMEDFRFYKLIKRSGLPYCVIPESATVSSRKYNTNSYLRVNLVNLVIFILFHMGLSGHLLKKMYGRMLRTY